MALLVLPGAYEPPKAVKEHETQFHDNPNYVTKFEIRRRNSQVLCNRIETSYDIECDDVQQVVEVRTVTPVRKKTEKASTIDAES